MTDALFIFPCKRTFELRTESQGEGNLKNVVISLKAEGEDHKPQSPDQILTRN